MKILFQTLLVYLCLSLLLPAEGGPTTQPAASPVPATGAVVLQASDKDALKAAIGKTATVTGKVQRAHAWDGGITFLNLDGGFTVVCFKKNHAKFPSPPDQLYSRGKTIEVTGNVRLHKDRPEIEITGPDQIKVVADAPAAPPEPGADKPKEETKPAEEKETVKP